MVRTASAAWSAWRSLLSPGWLIGTADGGKARVGRGTTPADRQLGQRPPHSHRSPLPGEPPGGHDADGGRRCDWRRVTRSGSTSPIRAAPSVPIARLSARSVDAAPRRSATAAIGTPAMIELTRHRGVTKPNIARDRSEWGRGRDACRRSCRDHGSGEPHDRQLTPGSCAVRSKRRHRLADRR